MRWWVIYSMSCLLFGCNGDQGSAGTILPPPIFLLKSEASLRNQNGTWHYQDKVFSGYILDILHGDTLAKLPIVAGKEHGLAQGWYASGRKKYECHYAQGKREGKHTGWHENDTLSYAYFFKDDLYEGVQRTYFKNGKRWQELYFAAGREEGKQKTWNEEGRVINNFTVKKGKLYGVVGRYDCMSVQHK